MKSPSIIFIVKNTVSKGKGLFSTTHIPMGQVILPFEGKVLKREAVYQLPDVESQNFLQLNATKYLNLSGTRSFFLNHSCNPNTRVKIMGTAACLVALRDILPHEELVFDYSSTSNETPEDWSMLCFCQSWNCRKTISGFSSLPEKIQETYLKNEISPPYLSKL